MGADISGNYDDLAFWDKIFEAMPTVIVIDNGSESWLVQSNRSPIDIHQFKQNNPDVLPDQEDEDLYKLMEKLRFIITPVFMDMPRLLIALW